MVDLNIKNNQGLTQALRDYALENNLIKDAGEISKEEWENTIFKLAELQSKRESSNSIFTGGSNYDKNTANDWHKNFVVEKGKITLSENELNELLTSMGLKVDDKTPKIETKIPTAPIKEPDNTPATPEPTAPATPDSTLKSESPEITPQNQVTTGKIESDKINGTYEIAAKDDGNGYTLKNDFNLNGQKDVAKFYNTSNIKHDDQSGEYSIRGLKSKNYNILQAKMLSEIDNLTINHAVYMDLKKKDQNSLTEPEKLFMNDFIDRLAQKGFALDAQSNEIIEANKNTTESTKRKKFLGIF